MGAMALQDELDHLLDRLRRAGTNLHAVEVKEAGGGYPKSLLESVSAFANTAGGTIVLGLAEHDRFTPVEINAPQLAADLAAACADQLEPAIRPEIDGAQVDGAPVVVAVIDELPSERKPCYVKTKGMERGSYLTYARRRPTAHDLRDPRAGLVSRTATRRRRAGSRNVGRRPRR